MKLKKDGTPRKNCGLTGSKILDIARPMMARPQGCSSHEVFEAITAAGIVDTQANCYEAMKYQAENGRATMRWRVAVGRQHVPYGVERVFFATAELAEASATHQTKQAAMQENAPARMAALEARKEKDRLRCRANRKAAKLRSDYSVAKPRKAIPAPVRIHKPSAPVEIDYSRAKITVIPTRRGRYELEPGMRVVGGFASSRIGIDALTGKPWESSCQI